ncbi:efflux RND transporter periplasmic adaptor subunit [Oceanidesulfovibrio marinus]|uniref:Efflux RND transporter periplasmic adaptor subunit n=1 Tax=Oceanidesulfovibrio marinus TaxID=370038 RepID=A0ABX6NM61_9BACT|nr:efflux RND transporter periplasmic adaptor subunit [Oceanidesulfovibrio marinus]QJT10797.1 efflux RND transporter periplasmic adaptor subunit [Oceanidesulfovibrio marinus]
MKKTTAAVIAALLLGLVGWQVAERISATGASTSKSKGPRAVPVMLEPVRTMNLQHVAEFTGTLESSARFTVAPKISGRIESLYVDIGDQVTNGQLLAELDSNEYALQVGEAKAALEVARATVIEAQSALDVAERDLRRSRDLHTKNAVSQSELDQALAEFESSRARLQVAQAQVRQMEAALEAARVRLDYTRIHARWDDPDAHRLVGERFVDEGDMVDSNDPIVSVVALDELRAVINVIERDFPYVHAGQPAEIAADAYPDRTFPGTVSRVAPVLQESSRQARVEIVVPNAERLLAPGMFVRARLRFEEREDVTAVPQAALARRDNSQGVFLAVDNASDARFVPFTPGINQDGWVEVLGDAKDALAGGRVVTLGKHLLEDGSAIALPAPDTPMIAPNPDAATNASDKSPQRNNSKDASTLPAAEDAAASANRTQS